MEEKRRDAGTLHASAAEPHSADPPTRRRPGAPKRKASALGTSSPPSLPSKRFTREKHLMSQNQIQNGPLTRGRQVPAASGAIGSAVSAKIEEKASAAALEVLEAEEERKAIKAWEALEAATEAEFEALRSRDRNAHVVPNHCGWFSWTKVHSLEERALPSFFNGKSETRTPEMYMEIRNWIMKKFHADPNRQIEVKDLEEFEVGDLDARQEILEFLDYWGLINFHPFPPADATMVDADNGEVAKKDSVVEQLYKFETVQSCYPIAPKIRLTTPTMVSGLFSEPTVAEELVEPEGPSVEYHCNSCSADCSRTRYHCQKQADFDLCTDCFKDGKFGSGMSSSDFILMEPAEVHGVAGGTWTDQETLLLLEALELYKENWNEIAEHVATKTKAQCILHFVQMPIEDSFMDSESDVTAVLKENVDSTTVSNNASIPKEAPETKDNKGDSEEAQVQNSATVETVKQEDAGTEKVEDSTKKENDRDVKIGEENLNPTTGTEVKAIDDKQETCAIKALREAFEALGYSSTPENPLSFADVGNPAMALAGFLARLAGSDVATASARSSLKSLKCESPGMQLALKHCFILEDPPDLLKAPTASQCVVTETANQDDPVNLDKEKTQKVDGDSSIVDGDKTDPPSEDTSKAAKELDSAKQPCNLNVAVSELQKEQTSVPEKALSSASASEAKLSGEDRKEEDGAEAREKGVDMTDSVTCKATDPMKIDSVETPSGTRDEDMASDSLPADKTEQKPSPSAAEDQPNDHAKEGKESAEEKDDHKISKIKHAAITALSAAAVKAKLLAEHEEEQIKQLTVLLIEKQLHKLETKLALFNEIDNMTMRVREQIDRSRQRLYHERAQIIASRLGFPASSSSRAMAPQSMPPNTRIPMNIANLGPRGPPGMAQTQRPPLARPMGTLPPNPSFGGFVPSQSGQASR